MYPAQEIDQMTLRRVRELIRANFAARDELYAAAEALDDNDLTEICRRLADGLGGNAADLQQLLMIAGDQTAGPEVPDEFVRCLQKIVIEVLDERHGQSAVLSEAEAAERQLKEEYDGAIEATGNRKVEGLLRRQREDVAFGETVMRKVRKPDKENDESRD